MHLLLTGWLATCIHIKILFCLIGLASLSLLGSTLKTKNSLGMDLAESRTECYI